MTHTKSNIAKYASLTPYNYSFNNPITFNDPSGADPPQTINYSATVTQYYTSYTYDDRLDYMPMGDFICGQCWRLEAPGAMAFLAAATGYGNAMFGMGPGWRPGQSGFAPGSGNHWADGIGLSDWSSYGGSQMFRDGLADGLTAIGSQLYGYTGGKLTRAHEANGRLGFWEKYTWLDFTNEDASNGGVQLATVGIGLRFKAFERQQQTQGRPGPIDLWGNRNDVFNGLVDHLHYMGHHPNEAHNLSHFFKSIEQKLPFWEGLWNRIVGGSSTSKGLSQWNGHWVKWTVTPRESPGSDAWKTYPINMNLNMTAPKGFKGYSFMDGSLTTIYQVVVWSGLGGNNKIIVMDFINRDARDEFYRYLRN